ncbi:3'5'-cyclic nucleotide phosphodiesterase domain-containing protein [Toxoplasma gondii MAS]|uniref:3'5'-cyclic nucleotide phosphodiesterase domain-containing protein n=1 Tax=Toxoplasma gondii MAS TaxID=943118 RepID=A0A086QWN0_TOXGO|nr:3'5'-cyclic nucleotide phosphodiesterase domain-containing protein [Toxoplasma gondii MAS]
MNASSKSMRIGFPNGSPGVGDPGMPSPVLPLCQTASHALGNARSQASEGRTDGASDRSISELEKESCQRGHRLEAREASEILAAESAQEEHRSCARKPRASRVEVDTLAESPERPSQAYVPTESLGLGPRRTVPLSSAGSSASAGSWISSGESVREETRQIRGRDAANKCSAAELSVSVERSCGHHEGTDTATQCVAARPEALCAAFLPAPSPGVTVDSAAAAVGPHCAAEVPVGADRRRRLFAAPFSALPQTDACSRGSATPPSLFSRQPFDTVRSSSSLRDGGNAWTRLLDGCSAHPTSSSSSVSPPVLGSIRTLQQSLPSSDDDTTSARTDTSLTPAKQVWLLPLHGHSLSQSSSSSFREFRVTLGSLTGFRSSDSRTSASGSERRRSKSRGKPQGRSGSLGRDNRRKSELSGRDESLSWIARRWWTRDEDSRWSDSRVRGSVALRAESTSDSRCENNSCATWLCRVVRRLPVAPAQTFCDEDEKRYTEGVLRFSRRRTIPVAVAVVIVSFLYTVPFVLHALQEFVQTPSADRKVFVFFSSRAPPRSPVAAGAAHDAQLDVSAADSALQDVGGKDAFFVVASLVFWLLSLASVLVFAFFAVFGALFVRIEKILCVLTAVNFSALALAECFQALRISSCPPSLFPEQAAAEGGSDADRCAQVHSGLTPELLIIQTFFLIVLDFAFCVRLRISQWLHLCAVSLLLSLAFVYSILLPLPAYLIASLWGQAVIGGFVLGSLHLAALTLETERRRVFLHFEVAKARVAELQERAQTDKHHGKVAVFGLIHTLKQMDACMNELQNLAPEAADVLFQLDALRVQCLDIATSSENFYAVNMNALPTDVRDLLQLETRNAFDGTTFRDTQVLLRDSLSPRKGVLLDLSLGPACGGVSRERRASCSAAVSSTSSRESDRREAIARDPDLTETERRDAERRGMERKATDDRQKKARFLVVPQLVEHELLCHVGILWSLDLFKLDKECNGNALLHVGYQLLAPLLAAGYLTCSREVVLDFLYSLQCLYIDTPYHNQLHAASVAHLAFSICHFLDLFAPLENAPGDAAASQPVFAQYLSLAIAALGHDAGHPGRSNAFLVQTSSTLSVVYNDRSILENYHACLTFYTLSHRKSNIFRGKTVTQYRDVRKKAIELILSTDMSLHFEFLTRVAARRENPDFNFVDREEDRALVLSLAIKVADLGHCALDWEAHTLWSARLKEEFLAQGDEELRLGLPVSPLCDRTQQGQLARSQANFIEFLFLPLAQHLAAVAPDDRFEATVVTRARQNISMWERAQDEVDQASAK